LKVLSEQFSAFHIWCEDFHHHRFVGWRKESIQVLREFILISCRKVLQSEGICNSPAAQSLSGFKEILEFISLSRSWDKAEDASTPVVYYQYSECRRELLMPQSVCVIK